MKSRYVAYTQLNLGYIVDTMADEPLASFDFSSALEWATAITWVGLEIVSYSEKDQTGHVEFKASYKEGKSVYVLHEYSLFEKRQGVWLYTGSQSV